MRHSLRHLARQKFPLLLYPPTWENVFARHYKTLALISQMFGATLGVRGRVYACGVAIRRNQTLFTDPDLLPSNIRLGNAS